MLITFCQSKPTENPRLKGDKELKPVSMRVRDAAEALLTALLDYVVSTCCSIAGCMIYLTTGHNNVATCILLAGIFFIVM